MLRILNLNQTPSKKTINLEIQQPNLSLTKAYWGGILYMFSSDNKNDSLSIDSTNFDKAIIVLTSKNDNQDLTLISSHIISPDNLDTSSKILNFLQDKNNVYNSKEAKEAFLEHVRFNPSMCDENIKNIIDIAIKKDLNPKQIQNPYEIIKIFNSSYGDIEYKYTDFKEIIQIIKYVLKDNFYRLSKQEFNSLNTQMQKFIILLCLIHNKQVIYKNNCLANHVNSMNRNELKEWLEDLSNILYIDNKQFCICSDKHKEAILSEILNIKQIKKDRSLLSNYIRQLIGDSVHEPDGFYQKNQYYKADLVHKDLNLDYKYESYPNNQIFINRICDSWIEPYEVNNTDNSQLRYILQPHGEYYNYSISSIDVLIKLMNNSQLKSFASKLSQIESLTNIQELNEKNFKPFLEGLMISKPKLKNVSIYNLAQLINSLSLKECQKFSFVIQILSNEYNLKNVIPENKLKAIYTN